MNHADVLNLMLSNERIRLANASTSGEKALRQAWVNQLTKELACESDFCDNLSDDELLAQLSE